MLSVITIPNLSLFLVHLMSQYRSSSFFTSDDTRDPAPYCSVTSPLISKFPLTWMTMGNIGEWSLNIHSAHISLAKIHWHVPLAGKSDGNSHWRVCSRKGKEILVRIRNHWDKYQFFSNIRVLILKLLTL